MKIESNYDSLRIMIGQIDYHFEAITSMTPIEYEIYKQNYTSTSDRTKVRLFLMEYDSELFFLIIIGKSMRLLYQCNTRLDTDTDQFIEASRLFEFLEHEGGFKGYHFDFNSMMYKLSNISEYYNLNMCEVDKIIRDNNGGNNK